MNQRTLLTGASAALTSHVAAAETAMLPCPLLDAINEYRAGVEAYEQLAEGVTCEIDDDLLVQRTWGRVYLMDALPAATSPVGAIAALRCAIEEDAVIDEFVHRLMYAVIRYLETLEVRPSGDALSVPAQSK